VQPATESSCRIKSATTHLSSRASRAAHGVFVPGCPPAPAAGATKPLLVQAAAGEGWAGSGSLAGAGPPAVGSGLRSSSLSGGTQSLFDHALDHFRIEIAGSGLLGTRRTTRGQVVGLPAEPYLNRPASERAQNQNMYTILDRLYKPGTNSANDFWCASLNGIETSHTLPCTRVAIAT
jgi:hypothetical protein